MSSNLIEKLKTIFHLKDYDSVIIDIVIELIKCLFTILYLDEEFTTPIYVTFFDDLFNHAMNTSRENVLKIIQIFLLLLNGNYSII